MSTSTSLTQKLSPLAGELGSRRAELARLTESVVRRQEDLLDLRNRLRGFETRYMREVGTLYAALDELEARIAEHEVALYKTETAQARAQAARAQAQATYEAAHGSESREPSPEASPALKSLFRDVARRLHPDFAANGDEAALRTRLMARANEAYTRADMNALQRLLDDSLDLLAGEAGDLDPQAELARVLRRIVHAQRDLAGLELELRELPDGEIAQLKIDADAAQLEGRDLLAELAAGLRERIADAGHRLQFTQRQVDAFNR